jgi:hypothetical protein
MADMIRGLRRPQVKYAHKDQLLAVVASEVIGVSETHREMNIPVKTIERWRLDPKLIPYLEVTRERILEDVQAAAGLAWAQTLQRLASPKVKMTNRDLLAIATEATDKMQLLSGGATSRTETRELTDGFDEDEVQRMAELARQYLRRNRSSAGPPMVEVRALEASSTQEPDSA